MVEYFNSFLPLRKLEDRILTNVTFFMNMMSNVRFMFIYTPFISGRVVTVVTTATEDFLILVLPFRDPKLETNKSSAAMIFFLITANFGCWFPFITLREMCSEGRSMLFCIFIASCDWWCSFTFYSDVYPLQYLLVSHFH